MAKWRSAKPKIRVKILPLKIILCGKAGGCAHGEGKEKSEEGKGRRFLGELVAEEDRTSSRKEYVWRACVRVIQGTTTE